MAGNPDAFVILDFPATYAKVGGALLRTGKFDATKLFVGGGQPATIPSTVPKDSMEGARGTRPAVPLGATLTNSVRHGVRRVSRERTAPVAGRERVRLRDDVHPPAIAAKSNSGKAIAGKLRAISGPPGDKYTFLSCRRRSRRSGRARTSTTKASRVDRLGREGDPASATYDFYKYINSTLTVQRQYRFHGRILSLDLTPPTKPVIPEIEPNHGASRSSSLARSWQRLAARALLCAFDKQKLHNCGKTASSRDCT